MDIGLLWFDDGGCSVEDALKAAAEAYRAKFKQEPDTVYMHTSDFARLAQELGQERPKKVAGLEVKACINILPRHFWVGRDGT